MFNVYNLFRISILEANYYSAQIISGFGFDVLDLNYYFRIFIDHSLSREHPNGSVSPST
ncbi:unnamed protein product [Soboliphyme baturini]|uniref:Uncharacterized protein n=1 Tax=Soboliphyme baturini TaxID=241478 RepID=A0A183IFP5_9BILA|nr:unnamed protein product [Soboliphyme baturini]